MNCYIKGTKISLTNPKRVIEFVENYESGNRNYISLFGLYPLTESFKNKKLQEALNGSLLNPIHGKSIELYLKSRGYKQVKTVDGLYLLDNLLRSDITHYFYGTDKQTLIKIEDIINADYPQATVLGYKEPPLIDIGSIENNRLILRDFKEINELRPNIIWIGLGGIKQDLVMYNYSKHCENSLMIGVGAAFDYFAGNLSLSPKLIKSLGLRWLYRGLIQPKTFRRSFKTIKNIIHTLK